MYINNFDICLVFMMYFITIEWKQRDLMKWNGKHNAKERAALESWFWAKHHRVMLNEVYIL